MMRVLVVDDEPLARERLQRLLEELPGFEVAGTAGNGHEALERQRALDADVVLLDIRMPGMDGMEAARQLAALPRPPVVIFTTAYGEHALEAFEAQAIDYLLKPVRSERLQQALEKARRLVPQQQGAAGETSEVLSIPHQGGLRLVPLDEVVWFQADNKYVSAHLKSGEELLLEESLKSLEQAYPQRLLRIHRSALVSLWALSGMEKDGEGTFRARLSDTEQRPEISRRHAAEVRRLLKEMA